MARQNLDGIVTYPAAADFSASRGIGVSLNSSGQWAATTAGAAPDGILDQNAASGDQARAVMRRGIEQPALAGGTFAVGANLSIGTGGKFVASTTNAIIVAKAVEAGAANKIVTVLFIGNGGVSA